MGTVYNEFVKKPNEEIEYTHEMIMELQRSINDPIYFIKNYVKIQHPTKGAIKFDMYDYQEEAIRVMHENDYAILLQPRQTGKCVCADTKIRIRNKNTGEIKEVEIGDLYEEVAE